MKERPKGAISRAAAIAEGMAAAMRRMQRDREPRVLLYDETGFARLLQPEARGQVRALELATRMVELVAGDGDRRAGGRPPNGDSERAA